VTGEAAAAGTADFVPPPRPGRAAWMQYDADPGPLSRRRESHPQFGKPIRESPP